MKNLITLFLLFTNTLTFAQDKWVNIITPGNINEIKEIEGKYYFATDGGLITYDPVIEQIKRINVTEGLPSQMVEDITVDSKGNIWIGTYDNGLAVLEPEGWRHIPLIKEDDSDFNPSLYSIEFDKNDNLWVGTEEGVFKLVDGVLESPYYLPYGWEITKNDNGDIAFSGNILFELKEDSLYGTSTGAVRYSGYSCTEYGIDGTIYWGLNGFGIVVLKGEEQTLYDNETIGIDRENTPSDIEFLDNGEVWVVFRSGEVAKFDGTDWKLMFKIDLDNWGWPQIDKTSDENLLIGVKNKVYQVNKQTNQPELLVDITNQFPNNGIKMTHNELNEILILSEYRLFKFDSSTLESEEIQPLTGREDYEGLAFLEYPDHSIGFFEEATGTIYYQNEATNIYNPDSLPEGAEIRDYQDLHNFLMDSHGEFWLSTANGLLHYSNNEYVIYDHNNSSFTEGISGRSSFYKIAEDNNGDIWASHENGLGYWDRANKSWTFDDQEELQKIDNAIYINEDNVIWLSNRFGFIKYKEGEFTIFPEAREDGQYSKVQDIHPYNDKLLLAGNRSFRIFDGINFETYYTNNSGLGSNNCTKAEVDGQNNVWISHEYPVGGISVFTKDETTLSTNTLFDDNTPANFNVYPNPVKDFINIDFTTFDQQIYHLQLIDVNGKICFSKNILQGENQLKIYTGNLISGAYILQANSGKKIESHKIIIQ